MQDQEDRHDLGLMHDLHTLAAQAQRRRALKWLTGLGTVGALPLLGCGGGGGDTITTDGSTTTSGTTTSGTTTSGTTTSGTTTSGTTTSGTTTSGTTTSGTTGSSTCSTVPAETAGPYPADGSTASGQRLNALALSGIVRSDIRTSVASASGTAQGVPMTLTITLVNTSSSCAVLSGYAIYIWHCTRDGNYSLYSSGLTNENYLRGVQVTDANGQATFTTIFPGCYSGRWPHIHFEVYPSLTAATDATTVSDYSRVSQIALPEAACRTVYGSATGYSSSLSALNGITLASDNVFSDGYSSQMATVTGDVTNGYAATLQVGIAA